MLWIKSAIAYPPTQTRRSLFLDLILSPRPSQGVSEDASEQDFVGAPKSSKVFINKSSCGIWYILWEFTASSKASS
ncbi:MAG: hypothetical protein ACYTXY_32115, partial [Nostoc sp.]